MQNGLDEAFDEKTAFHSVHYQAIGHKYPIYKQTGGQIYLRIDEERNINAPWLRLVVSNKR